MINAPYYGDRQQSVQFEEPPHRPCDLEFIVLHRFEAENSFIKTPLKAVIRGKSDIEFY